VFSLIEAIAFLHQHQRERGLTEDGSTYIMANLDDYRLAYQLAKDVLATTLHELSREAKDLFDVLLLWAEEQASGRLAEFFFTRRDVRQLTDTEDHRLRQALQELVDMEYLDGQGGQGRTYHYRIAELGLLSRGCRLLDVADLDLAGARLGRLSLGAAVDTVGGRLGASGCRVALRATRNTLRPLPDKRVSARAPAMPEAGMRPEPQSGGRPGQPPTHPGASRQTQRRAVSQTPHLRRALQGTPLGSRQSARPTSREGGAVAESGSSQPPYLVLN